MDLTHRAGKPHYFSPEYIFAAEFSTHYDAFARYFPEFGRLRELSRVMAMVPVLKLLRISNLEKKRKFQAQMDDPVYWRPIEQTVEEAVESMRRHLDEKSRLVMGDISRNVTNFFNAARPACSYSVIKAKVDEFVGEVYRNVPHLESHIEQIFPDLMSSLFDYQRTTLLNDFFLGNTGPLSKAQAYFTYIEQLKILNTENFPGFSFDLFKNAFEGLDSDAYVQNVIYYCFEKKFSDFRRSQLAEIYKVKQTIPDKKQELADAINIFTRIEEAFVKMGLSANSDSPDISDLCQWVPANIRHERGENRVRLVYGGVKLSPNVKHEQLPRSFHDGIFYDTDHQKVSDQYFADLNTAARAVVPEGQGFGLLYCLNLDAALEEAVQRARARGVDVDAADEAAKRKTEMVGSNSNSFFARRKKGGGASASASGFSRKGRDRHAAAAAAAGAGGDGSGSDGSGDEGDNVADEFRHRSRLFSLFANVDEFPHPSGSAGASRTWTVKARLKAAQLPIEGKIRYIPPDRYKSSVPLPKSSDGIGYQDKFGNIWKKGPSRTKGQAFEWDVQLSKAGKLQFKWLKEDLSHLNVSLDGKITHLSK